MKQKKPISKETITFSFHLTARQDKTRERKQKHLLDLFSFCQRNENLNTYTLCKLRKELFVIRLRTLKVLQAAQNMTKLAKGYPKSCSSYARAAAATPKQLCYDSSCLLQKSFNYLQMWIIRGFQINNYK